jgi:sugar phosphate isomerase/epimerase
MFSRRCFVGSAAGAAALATVPRAFAAPAGHALKLGLASYSMRKQPLDTVIDTCKSLGVKYITIKDVHLARTDPPDKLKAAVQKIRAAGITITGGGVITMKPDPKKDEKVDAAFEARLRKDFEYAKTCGFPMIVAAPSVEALDTVEKLSKQFNMPIAIHNHGPEDKIFPTPTEILAAIKNRDKRIGVCMDIGHAFRAGGDPAKLALDCGPRLLDLHVKDVREDGTNDKGEKKWKQVEVGKGQIDLAALFKSLVKLKFKGHVALEYEIDADDPVAGIRASLTHMRQVAASLGAGEVAKKA